MTSICHHHNVRMFLCRRPRKACEGQIYAVKYRKPGEACKKPVTWEKVGSPETLRIKPKLHRNDFKTTMFMSRSRAGSQSNREFVSGLENRLITQDSQQPDRACFINKNEENYTLYVQSSRRPDTDSRL